MANYDDNDTGGRSTANNDQSENYLEKQLGGEPAARTGQIRAQVMALPQHSSSGGPRHGVPTRTADVRGQHPPSGCASPRVRHPRRGGQSSGTLPRLFLRTSGLGTVGMRQTLPPVRKAGRRPLPRRVVSALSSSCGGQMRVRSRRLAVFFFFITPPRDAASLRRDSDAMAAVAPRSATSSAACNGRALLFLLHQATAPCLLNSFTE